MCILTLPPLFFYASPKDLMQQDIPVIKLLNKRSQKQNLSGG